MFTSFFVLFCLQIHIVHNINNNKPRGYAFIEYEHERDMHGMYPKIKYDWNPHWQFKPETAYINSSKISWESLRALWESDFQNYVISVQLKWLMLVASAKQKISWKVDQHGKCSLLQVKQRMCLVHMFELWQLKWLKLALEQFLVMKETSVVIVCGCTK